tara:strand:- start:45 stop:557 length:513 start_codon:yes stop_codon:yes gene_type:complete
MKIEKKESWSNLAYSIVGIIGYWRHGEELFGLVLASLGVLSFYYHFTKTHQKGDWFGMQLALAGCTGLILNNDWSWFFLILYLTMYGFFFMGKLGVYIETGIVSVIAAMACYYVYGFWELLYALIIFGTALWVRSIDDKPHSEYHDAWGHTAWHFLTAIGFYVLVYGLTW